MGNKPTSFVACEICKRKIQKRNLARHTANVHPGEGPRELVGPYLRGVDEARLRRAEREAPKRAKRVTMQPAEYIDLETMLWNHGDIEDATFEEPKLLQFTAPLPPGGPATRVAFSTLKSGANNLVTCGVACREYFTYWHKKRKGIEVPALDYRRHLMMEQQAIISLGATVETFYRGLFKKKGVESEPNYTFGAYAGALRSIGLDVSQIGFLREPKVIPKVRDAFDLLFSLRNVIVHNGGIIDPKFYARWKKRAKKGFREGLLIRVGHSDLLGIREWVSLMIQEICRVVPGYRDVWNDYVQATGILIMDATVRPQYSDGSLGPEVPVSEAE